MRSETLAICRPRINFRFLDIDPANDRHQFVRCGTILGGARGGRLRYMLTPTDPQGLKVSSERPCKHPSCFWAYASVTMIIKATMTNPITNFSVMAVTPHVSALGSSDRAARYDEHHGRGPSMRRKTEGRDSVKSD